MTEKSNSYKPPGNLPGVKPGADSDSLLRGFAIAIPLSCVGFAIPLVCGFIIRWVEQLSSPYSNPPGVDFESLFDTYVAAAAGCAILFGLASILNYSPASRLGLIRSLLFVGLSVFAGIILSSIMTVAFDLEQRSYTPEPWYRSPIVFAVSIPVGYTTYHTRIRFSLQNPANRGAG